LVWLWSLVSRTAPPPSSQIPSRRPHRATQRNPSAQPPAPVPDLPCPRYHRRKSSNGGRRRRGAHARFFFLHLGGLPSSYRCRSRSVSEIAGPVVLDASSPALWWVLEHRKPLVDARFGLAMLYIEFVTRSHSWVPVMLSCAI
jgi:hypothetical protein